MSKIVPVVFSSDVNFLMPTAVAIKSLLECSTDCFVAIYMLISDDFDNDCKSKLTRLISEYNASIQFINAGDSFNNCFEIRGISVATYYRLFIPWLIPQHDKIIYCDGDVIFQQSILNLFNEDIGNNYIGGIRAFGYFYHLEKIGADPLKYINGGVQIINAKLWRDNSLQTVLEPHLKKKYIFQDQDIINIICKDKIYYLPYWFNSSPEWTAKMPKYHSQETTLNYTGVYDRLGMYPSEFSSNLEYPVIVHYAGSKPWKVFTYMWVLWWDVYKSTEFYDPTLELTIEADSLKKRPITFRLFMTSFIARYLPALSKKLRKLK